MRLKDFIVEARFDVTLDQFREFVKACEAIKYEDNEVYKYLQREYGNDIAFAVYNICSVPQYIYYTFKTDVKGLYKWFKEVRQDRFERIIGAGGYGCVMEYGDKVIKISYAGFEDGEYEFYKYQKKHKRKEFPIIYRFDRRICVMERLKIDWERSRDYMKWNNANWRDIDNPKEPNIGKRPEYYQKWSQNVSQYLYEIGEPSIGWPADIRSINLGWRGDELVVFDV